ncbi:hypothetical protein [Streptococcus uberis]|uniref:hypothetical protein n=1 Tax=Streptococcus uberis TaxID=1349 RepID=UPI001FF5675A|nr:hypothetical protein [Streptococcus uberis]MCK1226159.1 hypothetical protein [Streptococcus uberis]
MAYVEADYLVDVLGSVTEFETLGWIVYIPKLGRNVILSADLYNALDEQEITSDKSNRFFKELAFECFRQYEEERDKENGL